MEFDSNEELYFSWYLDELRCAGYIKGWKLHPSSFLLSGSVKYIVWKHLKTKIKEVERTLLKSHAYTPDFEVRWTNKAYDVFLTALYGSNADLKYPFYNSSPKVKWAAHTFVEIKPVFSRYNMARVFSLNQKWMYAKYGVYVQLIKPVELFKKTFAPERYLVTDKSGKSRKLDYIPLKLDEFIKNKAGN